MERKKIKPLTQTQKEFLAYSKGIADSDLMNQERNFTQHRGTTVYEHSIGVAYTSYFIAKHMPFSFREASLVKGALLHDYFLYDWHVKDENHKLHGFRHAKRALDNAEKDFLLNPIEKDIIERHMFPLNIKLPKYKESVIVCIADKICAMWEMLTYIKKYWIIVK